MNQTQRDLLILVLVSCAVRLVTALFIPRPGYMDTAYYAAGAVRIAEGKRFTEPFIWNYLSDPVGIPHPGFLYWMPLPSLLAAPFAALFPGSFFAVEIPSSILASLLPSVAYIVGWQVIERRHLAWMAGLLTLFSGFFFPYWTLPETFAPFALFGSLALWLAGMEGREGGKASTELVSWGLAGMLVGLAHLTRADGVLLLPVVALGLFLSPRQKNAQTAGAFSFLISRFAISRLLIILLGYLLITGPWFYRNMVTVGSFLSPAGSKTLWLTEYDDLFCYQCDLSLRAYIAWGWRHILASKLSALWINFQRFLAEDCLIFLFPLAIVGLYRLRHLLSFTLAIVYLFLIYLAHSVAFTFPGWRGGFFHSSSAVLPFLYAAAAEGLHVLLGWAAQRRSWRRRQAESVFTVSVVVAAAALSLYAAQQKVPTWQAADAIYLELDQWFTENGTGNGGVLVGNPPAFWYYTRRPAAVIPNGGAETVLEVADRYDLSYVLLEPDHPRQLADLYAGVEHHPRLQALETWSEGDGILYRIQR